MLHSSVNSIGRGWNHNRNTTEGIKAMEYKSLIKDDYDCLPEFMVGEHSHTNRESALALASAAILHMSMRMAIKVETFNLTKKQETHVFIDGMLAMKVFPTYPNLIPDQEDTQCVW